MTSKTNNILTSLRTRFYKRSAESVDVESKSFDIVISTETPVRTWIQNPENADETIEVDEILLVSGLDTSRTNGMPLVDSHDTFSGVSTILGKVDDVRIVDKKIIGTAVLNSRNSDLIDDIGSGHYSQISAGYTVNSYEIEYREDDVPVAYATDWTLYEASLVAVGADPNASVRSSKKAQTPKFSFRNQPKSSPKKRSKITKTRSNMEKRTMELEELETLVEAAETAVASVEEAVIALDEALEAVAEEIPEELEERMRRIRSTDEENKEERKRSKKRSDTEEDENKEEEEEIRSARSIAKSYGLTKMVDDMTKLGARSKEVKASLRTAISKKNQTVSSLDIEPRKRATEKEFSTDSIYARRNK